MFWCKQVDPFENKVKCEECKLYTDKSDAQKVKELNNRYYRETTTIYYCKSHSVSYDECFTNRASLCFYFKRMEVDKDGTPIGYKKLKV